MRFQFVPSEELHELFELPWAEPLATWEVPRLVRMARGVSRHVVRFVRAHDRVFALKETSPELARHEYAMLRRLTMERLPVVDAIGLVTERRGDAAAGAILVTRYLDYSLPYRYLFSVEPGQGLDRRLIDAAVVLLVRLHLDGFYWGDCSLSNLLFRRDAGALMAYLVDAETARHHERLADGARENDVSLARENVAGGLFDLQERGRLGGDVDVVELADRLEQRYHALWDELTGADEISADQRHEIDRRIRRLNELGFDVDELVVEHDAERARLRVQPALVEEGHHHRELRRLTGLDVQENQARRLLNDIAAYGATLASTGGRDLPPVVVAARWLTEVFEPITSSIPEELRGRLEPPELFHELLEHRYYLAEQTGHEVDNATALRSYLEHVLRFRRDERLVPTDRTAETPAIDADRAD